MASAHVFFTFFLFNMTLITPFFANGEESDGFAKSVLMNGTEKLTHLHFYFHDIISGTKPSAVQIAGPENFTGSGFGTTMIMDDALTEGPEPTSKVIGRAQGIYASAALEELGLLMVLNFAFLEGQYNGSTLSVLGRNSVSTVQGRCQLLEEADFSVSLEDTHLLTLFGSMTKEMLLSNTMYLYYTTDRYHHIFASTYYLPGHLVE